MSLLTLPRRPNTAAIASDVQNLRIAIETAAVDNGGHLPTVNFSGGKYHVTDSSAITQTLPAGDGVTAAGITGSADDDYCVWVMTANGITMHATHSRRAPRGRLLTRPAPATSALPPEDAR